MTKADLLQRIEAASGPDREIDALVWTTFGPADGPDGLCGFALDAGWHYEYVADQRWLGEVVEYAVNPAGERMPQHRSASPLFTASIDAALALKDRVLPGCACAVGDMAFSNDPRGPWATIWTPCGEPKWNAAGKAPALAVLAAIIRALIAKEAEHG